MMLYTDKVKCLTTLHYEFIRLMVRQGGSSHHQQQKRQQRMDE